ncbi:hypothetical protein HDU77_005644 [Chytriomyces hyalinus]|nr:hypothetical protein HDU77_005644 [Chytriomyces hyalinus]
MDMHSVGQEGEHREAAVPDNDQGRTRTHPQQPTDGIRSESIRSNGSLDRLRFNGNADASLTNDPTSDNAANDLEYALQVGQLLLDQNRNLEADLRIAKEESEVLLSLLSRMDPDAVTEAMADIKRGSDEELLASTSPAFHLGLEDRIKAATLSLPRTPAHSKSTGNETVEMRSALSQIDELKDQVETLTTKNSDLRMQNLDLLSQFHNPNTSKLVCDGSPPAVSRHVQELETRVQEYSILVNQLQGQLELSKHQISVLKSMQSPFRVSGAPLLLAPSTDAIQTPAHTPFRADSPLLVRNLHAEIANGTATLSEGLHRNSASVQRNSFLSAASSAALYNNRSTPRQSELAPTNEASLHLPTLASHLHLQQQQQPQYQHTYVMNANRIESQISSRSDSNHAQDSDWELEPVAPHSPPEQAHFAHPTKPASISATPSSLGRGMVTVQNVTTHVEHLELTAAKEASNESLFPSTQVTLTSGKSVSSAPKLGVQNGTLTSATNVNVIVRLMVGSFLDKFNRRRTKSEKRFVNVNPYSRTISWSKYEPGSLTPCEISTVFMKTVYVEDLTDGTSRIVVSAPNREVVFQCSSAAEHAVWERGLTLILQNQSKNGSPFI